MTITYFNNSPGVKIQSITLENSNGKLEVFVPKDDRVTIHIDSGKKEVIEAIVKCHLKGGIKETKGKSIETLMTTVEEMICFDHNKQGVATKLDNNTLSKYFKEAEKKALISKNENVNILKKEP